MLILAAVLAGCSKPSPQKNFVARVNNSYLTENQLDAMIDTGSTSNFYRSEVIRNWINRELLYQQAVKKGILKSDEYKKLTSRSSKEIAVSLLLQKYYEDEKVDYEPKDLEDFYNSNKDEFKRFYDSYYINIISFDNEDNAIQFRSTVLASDWESALNIFKDDSSIVYVKSNALLFAYEIHPVAVERVVTSLSPGEVSIVIVDQSGRYTVVNEIQKYSKDTVPPFEVVRPLVEGRFVEYKKENLIQSYIKDLYSNNDIEVRN